MDPASLTPEDAPPEDDPEEDPLEEPAAPSSPPLPELDPEGLLASSPPNPLPFELLLHEGSTGDATAPTMASERGHKKVERSVTETSSTNSNRGPRARKHESGLRAEPPPDPPSVE